MPYNPQISTIFDESPVMFWEQRVVRERRSLLWHSNDAPTFNPTLSFAAWYESLRMCANRSGDEFNDS